ncbi:MAG: type I methionyl aminopeptidase [Candidatus Levybacteria bacterium]|nr:type I methionyl aminopeptidase [Candidatus Levybacteria bacterium]
MVNIKTDEEIEKMRKGGKILAEVLSEVLKNAQPGVSELELDKFAQELIIKKGAEPGFKKVPGYKHAICVSTNEVVVHGIPTDYKLKEGDVFGVDCGVYYQGFNTDMAETLRVSNQKSKIKNQKYVEVDKFLETGKRALEEGIKQAKAGSRVGHISKAIQDTVVGAGYSVVESLVGHGVGKDLHEDPEVPGFLAGNIEDTPLLKVGMTIAVEVIYSMGKKDVVYKGHDQWTIKTEDNSLSGLYERTIVITKQGPVVLTN